MSESDPELKPDSWLGSILGRAAFRLRVTPELVESLAESPGAVARRFAELEEPSFAFAKVGVRQLARVHAVERLGFRLIDTSVVLDKRRIESPAPRPCEIRFAEAGDEDGVADLARASFSFSRFHLDPRIPHQTADTLKSEWARNFFHGRRGDRMVVAVDGGRVVGFNQILFGDDGWTIDLIAVDAGWRRRGVAGAMIRFAEAELTDADIVRVGTQLANLPSIQLYESLGFRLSQAQYVFHLHRPEKR